MSLATKVSELATSVGTEIKKTRTWINGNAAGLESLTTTANQNLVAAINEVNAAVAVASGIDDAQTGPSTSWSSQKTRDEIDAAAAAATADAIDGAIDDGAPATGTAWSSSKTRSEIDAATAALIDDTAQAATTTYSSQMVDAQIAGAKDEILGGAGAAVDTLGELQALMEADDTQTTGILDALGKRVRVDEAQPFTAPQQAQARTNIDAASTGSVTTLAGQVGNVDTDFVAALTAALV
jgi:hypothetical protein